MTHTIEVVEHPRYRGFDWPPSYAYLCSCGAGGDNRDRWSQANGDGAQHLRRVIDAAEQLALPFPAH